MKTNDLKAIYVMWLREQKLFLRSKSRVIGTLMIPLMFLIFLSFGFGGTAIAGLPKGTTYLQYLVPGIVGMGLLFRSIFFGVAVLWDRQFGFLKEIMIAPVSRLSLMLGRTLGGVTTVLLQGILIIILSIFLGFTISVSPAIIMAPVFMVLIAIVFISLGLVFATQMKDMEGFSLIMNFVTFPLFFLSGALYPMENVPGIIKLLSYANPLTYGVDGLRATLVGFSSFPLWIDLAAMMAFALIVLGIGAYLFEKSEVV
jgi:ABC-2 type transport system permease protein